MSSPTLYLIATPIGNLDDISNRAIQLLKTVDLIAAENPRASRTLLARFDVKTRVVALHAYNEARTCEKLLTLLQAHKSLALISDAGTPLISDPGFKLVRMAHQHQIKVVPIPGACALISGLIASGLPANRFIFEGFLPIRSAARQKHLAQFKNEHRTVIFYEAPHRIVETLADCITVFGPDRMAALARELTKLFETIRLTTLLALQKFVLADPNQQKGEIVLCIGPEAKTKPALDQTARHVVEVLMLELSIKQAARLGAQITGLPKRLLYDYALSIKKD